MAERSQGAVRGMAADFCTHRDLRAHPTQRHTHRAAPNTPDTVLSTQCNETLMHVAIFAFVLFHQRIKYLSTDLFVRCRVGVLEVLSTNLLIPTHTSRKWGGGRKMRKVSFF
jgi:hypothetical protein